ncbi:unnamed protein product [Rhodiola kirilowii]
MADNVRLKPYDGTTNFSTWRVKMKAILIREKCYRTVTGEWLDPTSEERKHELRELAHLEIMVRLANDVLRQVVSISDAKELWDTLETIYLTKSLPSRIALLCKLFNFRMDTSLSIQENLDAFLRMTQDLSKCKDKIQETHQAVIVLNVLPPQFDIVKDVIQYGRDEISLAKITETIVQKNDTLKVFKSKGSTRLETKSDNKNEVMMFKGKKKHKHNDKSTVKPNFNSGQPISSLATVKCYYCGKNGHYATTCTKKQTDRGQNGSNKDQNAKQNGFTNVCKHGNLYRNELLVVTSTSDVDSLILDSGCTMHATPSKSLFNSLKLIDGGEVILGDHTTLKIKGIGSVPLVMFDGVTRIVQNVRWVPHLRRNLLSESVFDDQHLKFNISIGIKEVIKNDKTVIRAIKKGGLYFVETSHELNDVDHHAAKNLNEIKQWHARLGHIGNKGLSNLAKSGVLTISPAKLTFCETCILSKKTAHPFPKSSYKAVKPLECVHANLWDPSQVPTIGGRLYFPSLIDQFSRRV